MIIIIFAFAYTYLKQFYGISIYYISHNAINSSYFYL